MGIYLVDISGPNWRSSACEPLLGSALAARGLPPYSGPLTTSGSFEEKMAPSMDTFADLCVRYGATQLLDASLIVPVDFPGLIELPVETSYDDVTNVFSAQRLSALIAPMAAEVRLPPVLPSGPLSLTNTIDDPLVFYVAVFQQAAACSLQNNCPLTYV